MGMTAQEAIEGIKNEMECVLSEHSTSYFDECLEVAYASMEKQIAKKPITQEDKQGLAHEKCPSCGSFCIGEYCLKCGQKIDWGNEDDRD